ncbi:MAG: carbohydrate kinase [Saprospiraceae bacterium]|nr:carbohydrate kinase [Saprospiraceae bacterium]
MKNKNKFSLPDFSDLHILVIGDVMIDRYISGEINRISPEAPVPVVNMSCIEDRLGGAANVALNLNALGSKVTILSMTGEDEESRRLAALFAENKSVFCQFLQIADRKTTVKTRVMAGSQHVLRIDNEDTADISPEHEDSFLKLFHNTISNSEIRGVILQDYNKGLLTSKVIKGIMEYCVEHNILTFVDPKERNFFAYYKCTLFKPNKKEIFKALQLHTGDYDHIDTLLRSKMHHNITFITLGSGGIYASDGVTSKIYPTSPRTIADVCGAGDTVISIVALCYLKGMDLDQMAMIANIAGGQVCEYPGVVSVKLNQLMSELVLTD